MNLSSSENLQKKRERESEQLTDINIDLTNENEKKVDDPEDYCKVYENKEYKHLFFGGIWKLEILNNYFNFPFQLQMHLFLLLFLLAQFDFYCEILSSTGRLSF